ncbi:Heterokaryon incompatibility protein (HET) domain containing protein [Rhypophila sp. PSN 637]
MENTSSIYTPLSDTRSIRILVLKPALLFNAPIKCSFLPITLAHAASEQNHDEAQGPQHSYEALSYTWGAPAGTKPVTCDGHTLLVTPNCDQALRHLRLKFRPRNLWIDALCINQQSLAEKNHQVPIMGEIYRGAIRTILWLGPDEDADLAKVLRHARRFGHLRRAFRRIKAASPTPGWDEQPGESYLIFFRVNENERGRVATLCANEWFKRWTIQEFLLSRSSFFRMGDVECPSSDLYWYYTYCGNIVGRADLEHYEMRNTLLSFSPSKLAGERKAKDLFTIFLYQIIKLGACNKSADARDKIYAIYAYVKLHYPDFDLPQIDYSTPVAQLYEMFTRSIIAQTNDLWVLEIANTRTLPIKEGGSDSRDTELQLPSWVLDLRHPQLIGSLWTSRRHKFRYEISERALFPSPTAKHNSIQTQLPIRVKRIATVTDIGSRMPSWDLVSSNLSPRQRLQELDNARTACLSEWTAFVVHLDEKDNLTQKAKETKKVEEGNSPPSQQNPTDNLTPLERKLQTRGRPSDDFATGVGPYYWVAFDAWTQELDYLRRIHTPLDDGITINSDVMPWWSDQTKIDYSIRERSQYDDTHDMCVLFSFIDEEGGIVRPRLGESQGDVRLMMGFIKFKVAGGLFC